MIGQIKIFLEHYDNYLDIILGLSEVGNDKFNGIRVDKIELNRKKIQMSNEEYLFKDAEIFHNYLQLIDVV